MNRVGVEWSGDFALQNNINTGVRYPGGPWSGGEWYDAEALYLDVVQRTGKTYLEWLMISSYAGADVDETSTNPGWCANLRDHGTSWAYRSSPVIAIDLDNTGGYEWGLVLDTSEANGAADGFYDITQRTMSAALYSVSDQNRWKAPPSFEFPSSAPSDLNTSGLSGLTSADSHGAIADDHVEAPADQIPGSWSKSGNCYYWGSMDISSISSTFVPSLDSRIHYSIWCGNDTIDAKDGLTSDRGYNPKDTPELSSGALMLLGMLPMGLGWWRRRRK
jgi:hypothetical protein